MKISYRNPFFKGQWLGKDLIPTLAFGKGRKMKDGDHNDIYQEISLDISFLKGFLSISTLLKVKNPVNTSFYLTPSIIYYNPLHFKKEPGYRISFLHKEFKLNNK